MSAESHTPEVQRDTCYLCGNPHDELFERHHIVPTRFEGSDEAKNLVDVCPTCHRKLERLYDHRFYEQLRDHFKKELTEDQLVASSEAPSESKSESESKFMSGTYEKQSVKRIVAELEESHEYGAPIEKVYEEHPKSDDFIRDNLSALRTEGQVYKPKEGHLRTT